MLRKSTEKLGAEYYVTNLSRDCRSTGAHKKKRPDISVNNAGFCPHGEFSKMDENQMEEMLKGKRRIAPGLLHKADCLLS